ncbi:GNAT family N-acetyltransferase [Citricoccus sp. GCM10030269]|uniref:GNAT family N-acetyltransferase n=1 Tax=Citricoccus sp. GCM10030269 TaxID=3273388 RepID=UPI00360C710D
MTVPIGLASPDEIPACARLIAEALRNDPVVGQVVRGDRDRVKRLTALYTAALRTGALPRGVIDVARAEPGGPIIGVAAWEGPHRSAEVWRHLLEVARYLRAIGLRHLPAALRALGGFGDHRPKDPHWYLADIAVGPKARGLGVGSALLLYRLAAIDAVGAPAYLEATTPASRHLYERHGFEAAGAIDLAPGVSGTAMIRSTADRV